VSIVLSSTEESEAYSYRDPVSEVGDAASRDGLSGINLHTNGTEFYGNSSNLAFLGNLYARAQNQAGSRYQNLFDHGTSQPTPVSPVNQRDQPLSPETSQDLNSRKSGNSRLSIVNLLYNADYNGHPSPQSQSGGEIAAHTTPSVQGNSRNRSINGRTLFKLLKV
jgi:hypothetical protein